ncbi:hypothetical protein [Cryobacterium sp. TMT4-31]|uniref:hypothetical protein n=1 Tax=Cryobacterium sp. TMT4-31 TaxID=1259259 RepID=UPI00106C5C8C|nr:hypothetical protein [Cryobacterium sp. TMT4-31]TFC89878.1 hypothetical protein E3T19_07235 [Cryobacterium sp. TMT4-31]
MSKPIVLVTAIVAASITLSLSAVTISPSLSAWAEEVPPGNGTEEPVVSPSEEPTLGPIDEPIASEPPIVGEFPSTTVPPTSGEEPISTPDDSVSPTVPTQQTFEESTWTTAPDESYGGNSREDLVPVESPSLTPGVPTAPMETSTGTTTPTPSPTSKSSLNLEKVEYAKPSEFSSSATLAVATLIVSLALIVLLGLGNLHYRMRIAHRSRPRAFPRR